MKIRFTLHKDGTQKVEVIEGCGNGCVEATAEVEKRLGAVQGKRTLKEEFHQTESETEREREGG